MSVVINKQTSRMMMRPNGGMADLDERIRRRRDGPGSQGGGGESG